MSSDLVLEAQTVRAFDSDGAKGEIEGETLVLTPDATVASDAIHRHPGEQQGSAGAIGKSE